MKAAKFVPKIVVLGVLMAAGVAVARGPGLRPRLQPAGERPAPGAEGVDRDDGPALVPSLLPSAGSHSIVYVDDDAPLGGNGLSWAKAYRYLQDALADVAGDEPVTEIRVAGGVYKPDQDEGGNVTPGDRVATFQLLNGVTIRGGYLGVLISAEQGDWDVDSPVETILSGDLLGDDGPDRANNGENSYHVVTGSGTNATAVLDRLTIIAGNADGPAPHDQGGGVVNSNGSPTLAHCTIMGNEAAADGGGFSCDNHSNTLLTHCTISANEAAGNGGGLSCDNHSNVLLTQCTFSTNRAVGDGGGVYCYFSNPVLTDCTLRGNETSDGIGLSGGGGLYCEGGYPRLMNCAILGNTAVIGGGVRIADSGDLTLKHCTIRSNTAMAFGGGLDCMGYARARLVNCKVTDNVSHGSGGGISSVWEGDLVLTDCTIMGNAGGSGGGIFLGLNGTLSMDNCRIMRNRAGRGGGINCSLQSSSTIVACKIIGNTAFLGGGLSTSGSSQALVNCLITGNMASVAGGGLFCALGSHPVLTNCTIASNSGRQGGGILCDDCTLTLANCIMWGDAAGEIHLASGSAVVTYSDIQGGWAGQGNINANPQFIDPTGPDGIPGTVDDDLHLLAGSPCVDAGKNNLLPLAITTDLDGNPRIVDGDDDGLPIVDMGAYERPPLLGASIRTNVEAAGGSTSERRRR